jgi:aspartyl-tRNA(Asn)/glutamyl-tRNA(Gln) amidotransferase subunit C
MQIDKMLISKLEKLSRLELAEQEKISIQKELNEILSMVEKLNELDTTGVEPLIYISAEENVLRVDKIKNQLPHEVALKNAPLQNGEYFLVPKVITKD